MIIKKSLLLWTQIILCLSFCITSGCAGRHRHNPSSAIPPSPEIRGISSPSNLPETLEPSTNIKKSEIPGMAFIPGGEFIIGENAPNTQPEKKITLDSFHIDIYPVTYKDLERFQEETGYRCREIFADYAESDLPVTMVTYEDAAQYAKWAGKRLPTEYELEAAARGTEGRLYTWGNKWDETKINPSSKGPQKVGQYPGSDSVYGVKDLTGNIFHWTVNRVVDLKDPKNSMSRIIKAGGWTYFPRWNKSTFRAIYPEKDSSFYIGFRCVKPVDTKNDPNLKQAEKMETMEIPDQAQFETDDDIVFLFRPQIWPMRTLSENLENEVSKLKKGQTVADIGCGLGYLSYRSLPQVGKTGKVFAVDISKSSIEFIKVYMEKEKIHNLVPVHSKPDDISLPKESCDVIFLMGTIHCLHPDPIVMPFFKSCYKALKKGGRMIITESSGYKTVPERLKMIPEAGFKEVSRKIKNEEIMVIYTK